LQAGGDVIRKQNSKKLISDKEQNLFSTVCCRGKTPIHNNNQRAVKQFVFSCQRRVWVAG
jgi:hypothetical protein